ncbi:MAG: hypothetical protein ACREPT_08380 [Rudaea sp.]
MHVVKSASLIAVATSLITVFCIASSLAPPVSSDSRGLLVIAIGLAGLVFGIWACVELRSVNARLSRVQA